MRAILLAGGRGTRLKPFTNYINKHLLPLGNKPIIQHSVETLKQSGITDIAVVLGDFNCGDIVEFLGNGSNFGVNITYYYQGEALGIAQAVTCAKPFVKGEEGFIVYLGDSFFSHGITQITSMLDTYHPKFSIAFCPTTTPEKFGVPHIDDWVLKYIEEKPKNPRTNLSLTGCYYFNTACFFNHYNVLKPSARGEYELTDIINKMIAHEEYPTVWCVYNGWWMDAGTFEGIKLIEAKLNESNK